jgi:hypothetical protein
VKKCARKEEVTCQLKAKNDVLLHELQINYCAFWCEKGLHLEMKRIGITMLQGPKGGSMLSKHPHFRTCMSKNSVGKTGTYSQAWIPSTYFDVWGSMWSEITTERNVVGVANSR